MRDEPLIGRRSEESDQAGSARPATGPLERRFAQPPARPRAHVRARHWRRLDVANAVGIVFGLSCLAWLPAQAAVAAVLSPAPVETPLSVTAASPVAAASASGSGPSRSLGGALDGGVALAVADPSAGPSTVPTATPAADAADASQPDPTSRIAVRSKPVAATQSNVTKPNTLATGVDPVPLPAPVPAAVPATYTRDLYSAASIRYQDPDGTACTAAATEVMLNLTRGRGTTGDGFVWSATTSYQTQEAILGWERANDTLDGGAPGSDPHGWRNALNYYGWGSYATFGARHYEDLSYSSFAAATKAAVVAIARENKPVGILAWAGGHAQVMTGYEVYGADPAVSTDFNVVAVYLTDPLAGNHMLDARVTYANFQSGSTLYRFTAYGWKDSAADDPYMPGTKSSYTEWYGQWVIIAPVSFDSALPGAH